MEAEQLLRRWLAVRERITALRARLEASYLEEETLRLKLKDVINDPDRLTPREKQILIMLREQKVNKEIANELNLSVRTVKFHVSAILLKLNAKGRHDQRILNW